MSQTAVGKATGEAESCCASINLTDSHWDENAENILRGCLGMERYELHSCATQPGCHLADSTGCPKDWFPFGDSCFSPILLDMTWTKASDACKVEGGDLASVHSEEESAFISRLLPNKTCWIGANNVNFEEEWRWSDGSLWRNHSKAQRISRDRGMGAVGIDFRGNWHRLSTNNKEKHCSVCKLRKERSEDHDDGHGQQHDSDKSNATHSMWNFFWAILVLFVVFLAVGGAFYAKKVRQKRMGGMQMELSSVSTTTSCLDED